MLPADATFDMDGRVRFSGAVSAATIGRYRGDVLLFGDPYSDVDPDRTYAMLRDPVELRAATPSSTAFLSSTATPTVRKSRLLLFAAQWEPTAHFDGNMVRGTCTLWVSKRD